MIKFIIKKTINDSENVKNNEVRKKYNTLGGILGLICNFFLFILKVVCGVFLNSIAIISDAFNNFSDMGSSAITLVGTKMSNIKPDERHPFGHGRFEYIASFIVSFIIIYVGIELFRSSIGKIINPVVVSFNWIIFIILLVSVLVKIWMYSYNKYMGNKINSTILIATSKDSLNDAISTSIVVLSLLLGKYVNFPIDGVMGLLVSLLIFKSGIEVMVDTISLLLGQKPSKELVHQIEEIVVSKEGILGVHDLLVHDYGPGRVFASCHAEVLDTSNILQAHETIDAIEKEIQEKLGILISIHMDPITLDNPILNKSKQIIKSICNKYDEVSGHDFRIVDGEKQINIIFDLVVPFSKDEENSVKIKEEIIAALKEYDSRLNPVIKVEHSYCN